MSSDDKKAIAKGDEKELPLEQLATSRGLLPDKYDLDKNPIQFRQHDGSLSTEAHDKDYMELVLRSGKHSDLIQKLMRQKLEARAQEFPRWPGDMTGGVRALWIESRYWYDRERLSPHFDDDWRKYRSRYLSSLELDPSEPLANPEYERFMLNPIRRFYMKPMDWFEKNVIQKFTNDRYRSSTARVNISRFAMAYVIGTLIYYRLRYVEETWEWRFGQRLSVGKPRVYPGDPNWPPKETRTSPWHFYDHGFLTRNLYTDLRDYQDNTVVI